MMSDGEDCLLDIIDNDLDERNTPSPIKIRQEVSCENCGSTDLAAIDDQGMRQCNFCG